MTSGGDIKEGRLIIPHKVNKRKIFTDIRDIEYCTIPCKTNLPSVLDKRFIFELSKTHGYLIDIANIKTHIVLSVVKQNGAELDLRIQLGL